MSQNLRAILLMTLAMAAFAAADAMIKLSSAYLPVPQILLHISLGGLIIFTGLALARGEVLLSPRFFTRPVLLRNCAEVIGTASMIAALAAAPLVQVIAITQAIPVLVTLGAVFILREPVGSRRWAAVIVGLLGVLVILRPGADLTFGAILAVIAAAGLALRDVYTRQAPKDVTIWQLVVWGLTALTLVSVILVIVEGSPLRLPQEAVLPIGFAVILGAVAYLAITLSVRMAEVAAVTPFRYTRLLFGTGIGVLVFGERIDLPTMAGSLIVVCAGLYILYRERRMPLSRPVESQ